MAASKAPADPQKGAVGFDDQTIEDLDFAAIRGLLEDHCTSDSARRKAQTLVPSAHRPSVTSALQSTDELRRIRVEGYSFPTLVFEEIRGEIKLLEVSGSALTEAGFMRVLQCTRLVNDIVGALQGRERGFPHLCGMLGTVSENKEIVKEIPECKPIVSDLIIENTPELSFERKKEGAVADKEYQKSSEQLEI